MNVRQCEAPGLRGTCPADDTFDAVVMLLVGRTADQFGSCQILRFSFTCAVSLLGLMGDFVAAEVDVHTSSDPRDLLIAWVNGIVERAALQDSDEDATPWTAINDLSQLVNGQVLLTLVNSVGLCALLACFDARVLSYPRCTERRPSGASHTMSRCRQLSSVPRKWASRVFSLYRR